MKLFRKSDSQKYDPWRHSEVGADFSESKLNIRINQLTLIREFLGPSPSAFSGKRIQNHRWWRHSWDFENENYMCRYSVSWAILWYSFQMAYANMRGNMPRRRKIYAIFWDHHRAWFPEKKIHSTETYTNWFNAALWIFFCKTRSVIVPRFGFFSRIHG